MYGMYNLVPGSSSLSLFYREEQLYTRECPCIATIGTSASFEAIGMSSRRRRRRRRRKREVR
jgi:hypothetical protein